MTSDETTYRFENFRLDLANRQLWRGDARVGLKGRYFDALALLVREHGQLVEKEQFFAEVWGDVVVSDSALTQCIKDIRKQLGDDAADPRYVETVPRYGYRFVAPVQKEPFEESPSDPPAQEAPRVYERPEEASSARPLWPSIALREALRDGTAGTVGGAAAGICGGLLYGFGLAYTPADANVGIASLLVVMISLNMLVGLMGGFGVSFGLATARWAFGRAWGWQIAGAALGGLLIGGLAKLLGVDAFNLLFGRAPDGITGGLEGAALGAALALGAQLGGGIDHARPWRPVAGAGLAGAIAGICLPLAGGRLMGGSLELVARSFAGSQLQLEMLGRFFGEMHFGYTTQVALGATEGLLFSGCVIGAIVLARRHMPDLRAAPGA